MTASEPPSSGNRAVTSEKEAERQRTRVSDDLIPLPAGHLACEACGIATQIDVFAQVHKPGQATLDPSARCSSCKELRQLAEELAEVHPVLMHRLGIPVALDRIESTLQALAVIGRTTRAEDVPVMLTRLYDLGQRVEFRSPTRPVRRECSPYPWAHVRVSERAALRAAYGAALRDSLALSQPPVVIACPSTACLMCGVSTITRPAIEVSRRGSVEATQLGTWRAVTVNRTALGGARRPEHVEGHICLACTGAVDNVGGVGWRARSSAVSAYLTRSSPERAKRLLSAVQGDFPPALPGWGAFDQEAGGAEPWAHLRAVLDRL